jgi:hypothetical protein
MKSSHITSPVTSPRPVDRPISGGPSNDISRLDWLLAILFEAVWRPWRVRHSLDDAECSELDRLLDAPRGTSRRITDRLASDAPLVADLERHCSPVIPDHTRFGSRESKRSQKQRGKNEGL